MTDRELKRRDEKRLPIPEDVDPRDLDRSVRAELRSLSKETADAVARHLVAAGTLVDTDPATALAHAYAARAHAARVGVVREAVGVAAYFAEEWAVALAELRAFRRMSGATDHVPLEADCERALGRPDRAIETYRSMSGDLDTPTRIELLIVAAGARRDLGQGEGAVVMLQVPELETRSPEPWTARLMFAYADALVGVGRLDDAREWFERTASIDTGDELGASERLLELDGITLDGGDLDGENEGELEGELEDVTDEIPPAR